MAATWVGSLFKLTPKEIPATAKVNKVNGFNNLYFIGEL
jgi:hypothetical protein